MADKTDQTSGEIPATVSTKKGKTKPVKGKPGKSGSAKEKKSSFDFSKLSEKQWAMIGGGLFLVGYIVYTFLTAVPAPTGNGIGAPLQTATTGEETAEQKFKRENKNVNLPDGSAISQETLQNDTQITQQVPFGDKELEFRVRLPKDWVMSEFARYGLPGEETYRVLTNIGRYFGPAIEDARPFLWVEAERMHRYMSAETYARAFMIKRGISPEAFRTVSTTEVQALYVDVRDLQSYAVRTVFRIDGDTMVLTTFGVPVESYKTYRDMMAVTLNSFDLLHPITRQIEELKHYKLLNLLKFDYYASWQPHNEYAGSTLRPSVELHNPQEGGMVAKDMLQGMVLVNIWRKNMQFKEVDAMKEITDRLQELRMIVKQPLSPAKALPLYKNFIKAAQIPYLAQVNTYIRTDQFDIVRSEQSKTQQEIWITVLDNDYYVAYLTLITPLQPTNYVVWAQNMEAYNLLLSSINLRGPPTGD